MQCVMHKRWTEKAANKLCERHCTAECFCKSLAIRSGKLGYSDAGRGVHRIQNFPIRIRIGSGLINYNYIGS